MNTKYVIEDATLNNIANAIRGKTNETETIKTLDFASKIASIDLSTEEYMVLVDMVDISMSYHTLPTYEQEEIDKVSAYINFYGGELYE